MPRLLKAIRQRGRSFFFRVRTGGVDRTIPLGQDFDRAVTRALEIRRRIKAGLPPTEERSTIFTVRDAVKAWLDDHVKHNRHGLFQAETRRRCEKVLVPFMGDLKIEEVKASTLFAYKNHVSGFSGRRGPRFSERTVRMYLGDLRAALNHALVLGVLDRSPVPLRGWLPRKNETAPDVFTREEQAKLGALPGEHGRVVRLLLGTGLRWGEAVRAQAQDIQAGRLVIRKSKSGKPRRVPLPPDVLAECQKRVGRLCPFQDSVSFNKRVRALSGINRFHSHLCRHTFATEWRESGGSLAALQAVLGHSSVKVTEIYGTITDDLVEREASRLADFRVSRNGTKNGTAF